jgi:ankyrin repeat protein
MKRPIVKYVLYLACLVAAGSALYHYGGRWWAQRQVDQLLYKGPAMEEFFAKNPEFRQQTIEAAFIEAACENDDRLASAFLRAGYSPKSRNQEGVTPLHCAVAWGNLSLAKDLVGAGADIRARTAELELEPVHYAAWYRQWDLVRYLVGKGVSINEPSKIGAPAMVVANDGAIWRTDRLRPDVKNLKRPKASLAADVQELQSLAAALDTAAPDGTTLMHCAARAQDVALMDLLATRAGLSVTVRNQLGQTPLTFAFRDSAWEPVNGARSHVATVEWLVSHSADINARDEDGWSIALSAVLNSEFLALLPGLDLNVADDKGRSIWTSLGRGSLGFARSQGTIGAPLMTNGQPGTGPLHVYAKDASLNEIEYFLQRGVSPNQVDQDGLTPLHEVLRSSGGVGDVRRNRPLIVMALLGAGADVNARTAQGITPLMLAVDQPGEVVRILIEHRADVNAIAMENGKLLSVLDRFQRRANTEGIELLLKAGARTAAEKWDPPGKPIAGLRTR